MFASDHYDGLLEHSTNDDDDMYGIHHHQHIQDGDGNGGNGGGGGAWWPKSWARAQFATWFYVAAAMFDWLFFMVETPVRYPHGPELEKHGVKATGQFGWHFVHLTFWGGVLQAGYFTVCVLDMILRDDARIRDRLHRFRDRYFSVAFAIGSLICVGFWCILFPGLVGSVTPIKLWSDIAGHGVTSVLIGIEMFLVPHRYGGWINEATIGFVFLAVYVGWNLFCHQMSGGYWAYSIQDHFSTVAACFIYPLAPFLALGSWHAGKTLTNYYWGQNSGLLLPLLGNI